MKTDNNHCAPGVFTNSDRASTKHVKSVYSCESKLDIIICSLFQYYDFRDGAATAVCSCIIHVRGNAKGKHNKKKKNSCIILIILIAIIRFEDGEQRIAKRVTDKAEWGGTVKARGSRGIRAIEFY